MFDKLPERGHAMWPQVSGPYVTVAAIAVLEILDRMVPGLPDPAPLVLMAVVYAAFAGGLASGLFSAAMAVAFFAGQRALPGQLLAWAPAEVPALVLLGAVTPAIVVMVGLLKGRAERAFDLQVEHERLRAVDQMKTQFINNAAHELRTPLTPIVLQLHVLKQGAAAGLSDRQQKALELLDRNISRLNLLVGDLLEVAKLQAGHLKLERKVIDLDRVASEAVESFREPARQAGVELELRTAGGLVVEADAKRLIQVLFNLLSNALKFTPRGGRIAVESALQGGHAVVRVRDTGPGLTQEQRARLFEPFTQVHDAKTGPAGSGLGLYICRGILEQHGGRIWAESEGRGKGATFAFALPASAAPAPPPAPPPAPSVAEALRRRA